MLLYWAEMYLYLSTFILCGWKFIICMSFLVLSFFLLWADKELFFCAGVRALEVETDRTGSKLGSGYEPALEQMENPPKMGFWSKFLKIVMWIRHFSIDVLK